MRSVLLDVVFVKLVLFPPTPIAHTVHAPGTLLFLPPSGAQTATIAHPEGRNKEAHFSPCGSQIPQQTSLWGKGPILVIIIMIVDTWCGVWHQTWTKKRGILFSNFYWRKQINLLSTSSAVVSFHGKWAVWDSCSHFLWVCICFLLYFYERK